MWNKMYVNEKFQNRTGHVTGSTECGEKKECAGTPFHRAAKEGLRRRHLHWFADLS